MEGKKFLHGTLEVTIFHATPFTPSFPFSCLSASSRPAYVTLKIDEHKMAKTTSQRDRIWNQTFQILCAHPIDSVITLTVKTKCSVLGKIHFKAHHLVTQASLINGFFPLRSEDGKPKPKLGLQFILWFKPADLEPSWGKLIDKADYKGLRNATFPQRSNCKVTLYQDAHHHPSFQPPLSIPQVPRKLWEDVYKALEGAKILIYIVGWSFNPKMVLVRDPQTEIPRGRGVTIGELLKQKAEEGVAVRIMLWNDETSIPLIKNKGLMKTHDEDAMAYFKNTKVVCRLCPRLHKKFPTFFSHHQKTITVDTRVDNSPRDREIMSFIGGIDLCDGRYDTEQHSLFRTLNSESHANDFYQTNIEGASLHKGGPREPWHDAHACITGEVAWDVLTNFEQRWIKQCDPSLLIPATTIEILKKPTASSDSDRDWKVQVFRSIDHFSASPLSNKINTEQSIHEAYVEAIRKADRFIYIENQYFIGGCNLWSKDQNSGCKNLIPIEIALKIANKIRAKERFSVYVVIPMWPEGIPESESVQDILHWTWETMRTMYRLIGQAIRETGEQAHPRDYLNFFCLANREEKKEGELVPPFQPHQSTSYWSSQANRRFMIYVHSKLMIEAMDPNNHPNSAINLNDDDFFNTPQFQQLLMDRGFTLSHNTPPNFSSQQHSPQVYQGSNSQYEDDVEETVPETPQYPPPSATLQPTQRQQLAKPNRIWSVPEDKTLTALYMEISEDAMVGTNQTASALWRKVVAAWNEAQSERPHILPPRAAKSLENRWRRMASDLLQWSAAFNETEKVLGSGYNEVTRIQKASELFSLDSKPQPHNFTLHHCWEMIKDDPKFTPKLRWALSKEERAACNAGDDEEGSSGSGKRSRTDTNVPSTGYMSGGIARPEGVKKAKGKRNKGKSSASEETTLTMLEQMKVNNELRVNEQSLAQKKLELDLEKEKRKQEQIQLQRYKMNHDMLHALLLKPTPLTPDEEAYKAYLMQQVQGEGRM